MRDSQAGDVKLQLRQAYGPDAEKLLLHRIEQERLVIETKHGKTWKALPVITAEGDELVANVTFRRVDVDAIANHVVEEFERLGEKHPIARERPYPAPEYRCEVIGPCEGGSADRVAAYLNGVAKEGWRMVASHAVPLVDRKQSAVQTAGGEAPKVIGTALYVVLERWSVPDMAQPEGR